MTIQIKDQELKRICLEELIGYMKEETEAKKLIDTEDLPEEFQKPLMPEDYQNKITTDKVIIHEQA